MHFWLTLDLVVLGIPTEFLHQLSELSGSIGASLTLL